MPAIMRAFLYSSKKQADNRYIVGFSPQQSTVMVLQSKDAKYYRFQLETINNTTIDLIPPINLYYQKHS